MKKGMATMTRFSTFSAFSALCLLLAGCAGSAPSAQRSAADDPTAICLSKMDNHPGLAALKPHIASISQPEAAPLELRSSTATPSAEEKQALQTWAGLGKECVNAGAEFRLKFAPPAYADLVEEENARLTVLLSQLYAGQTGYGGFINERIALASEMASRRNNARGPHERANAPIREEEAARRRGELAHALVVLQLPVPRPGSN
jgi:hypothetical protein